MIWIIGEYAERIDNAAELLESFLEGFQDENSQVCILLKAMAVSIVDTVTVLWISSEWRKLDSSHGYDKNENRFLMSVRLFFCFKNMVIYNSF